MRWINYLESNHEAYEGFKTYIETQIEHHRQQLEDSRANTESLRFVQGCVATLRQILLEIEEVQKESKENDYRTDQKRNGPG